MDVATFGKAYCLNRNTVYRLVRQKSLPHVRIGKKIFFPVEAVEQFLMDQANRSMQG
jgi:excisionase family DNA binding protein